MWLEIHEPLKNKCLVNSSYNPIKNALVSTANSITDNTLLIGHYNSDQINEKRKECLILLHVRHQTLQIRTLLHASAKPIDCVSITALSKNQIVGQKI